MKKPVTISLYFLAFLIFGSLLGLLVGMNFSSSLSMVAGKGVFFSKGLVIYTLFDGIPVVLLLIGIVLSVYKVRHGADPVGSAIVYSALCAVTWIVLMPLSFEARKFAYEEKSREDDQELELSGGYFRESDGKLYYFLQDAQDQKADVLVLNDVNSKMEFGKEMILDVSSASSFAADAKPFKDPLIKDTMADRPEVVTNVFVAIRNRAASAWNCGIWSWLFFCGFGFAICACYGLVHSSSWRLVNILLIFSYSTFVMWFNNFYYSSSFSGARKFLGELMLGENYCRGKFFVDNCVELPLFIFNLIIGAVALIVGILLSKRER